jgi:hypothetical protein
MCLDDEPLLRTIEGVYTEAECEDFIALIERFAC